jgi:hypothetical protein
MNSNSSSSPLLTLIPNKHIPTINSLSPPPPTTTTLIVIGDHTSIVAITSRGGYQILLTNLGIPSHLHHTIALNVVNLNDLVPLLLSSETTNNKLSNIFMNEIGGPDRIIFFITSQINYNSIIPLLLKTKWINKSTMIDVYYGNFDIEPSSYQPNVIHFHPCPSLSIRVILPDLFILPETTTTTTNNNNNNIIAPTLISLGLRRIPSQVTSMDIDVETDMSREYRLSLKWISRCLVDVAESLNLALGSEGEGVCSLGMGSSLVANTCVARLKELVQKKEQDEFIPIPPQQQQDVLLIIDRSLDWFTPLSLSNAPPICLQEPASKEEWLKHTFREPEFIKACCNSLPAAATKTNSTPTMMTRIETLTSLEKLHDTLCVQEKRLSDVMNQIVDALEANSISVEDAKLLALRCYSKFGMISPNSSEIKLLLPQAENRLAMALNSTTSIQDGIQFINILKEASLARIDVARARKDNNFIVDYLDRSLIYTLLQHIFGSTTTANSSKLIMSSIIRASTGPSVTNLARGLLSSFLPLSSTNEDDDDDDILNSNQQNSSSSISMAIQKSRRLVIFFLGGVSLTDYSDIMEIMKQQYQITGNNNSPIVLVGGSHLLDQHTALKDAQTVIQPALVQTTTTTTESNEDISSNDDNNNTISSGVSLFSAARGLGGFLGSVATTTTTNTKKPISKLFDQ